MIDESDITEKDIFAAAPARAEVKQDTPDPAADAGQGEKAPASEGASAPEGEGQAQQREIPAWEKSELKQERQRRKTAEKLIQSHERDLAEVRGRMQMLEALANRQPPPQTQTEPPKPAPDYFTDAPGAIKHEAAPLIDERLRPVTQAQEQFAKQMQYNNRLIAEQAFTPAVVEEAERAFMTAVRSGQLSQPEYLRVVDSPNRFAEAARWHKERKVLLEVGDDQYKWFDSELEKRMATPEFQNKLVERLQARAEGARASGTGQPVFNLPPSLNKAPGGAGNGASGPFSEADIFAAAPSRMGLRG